MEDAGEVIGCIKKIIKKLKQYDAIEIVTKSKDKVKSATRVMAHFVEGDKHCEEYVCIPTSPHLPRN